MTHRLDQLAPRQRGIVDGIEAGGDEMERLKAMGVCVGRCVELVMKGDPLILKVFGSRVGVSERLASGITVQPCAPAGSEEGD